MTFPETLDIIASDLGGDYFSQDCVIARALDRHGIPSFRVESYGRVAMEGSKFQYKWEDGTIFCADTARKKGRLVRHEIS